MEETKLRQLFKNRADAYLNTIDESVEQGMSEDCFIKAVNEVFSLRDVVKCYSEEEIEKAYDRGHENGYRKRIMVNKRML